MKYGMPKGLILYLLILFQLSSQAQEATLEGGLVKWLDFKEAQELNKKQPKPILIDVYTDWCGWCKKMMQSTYSDPNLAGYINANYYPIKFNAETQDTIEYNGAKYWNTSTAKKSTHQLAIKLLGTSISYPTTIFVNNNFQYSLVAAGYLESKKLEPLLVYSLENVFRSTPYEEFSKNMQIAFYDTTQIKIKPNWLSFNQALEKQKKNKKKIIVSINAQWCNSCRVMNRTTFSDSLVNIEIKKNFYLVDFNALNTESIEFKGTTYKNQGNPNYPFHDIIKVISNGNFILPSLAILDEDLKTIDLIPYYQSPENFVMLSRYFGSNAYKTKKWQEFIDESKKKKK